MQEQDGDRGSPSPVWQAARVYSRCTQHGGWGKQYPSPAAAKHLVDVVPSLTVPLWFSSSLHRGDGTEHKCTPSIPAAPNPNPCPGCRTVQGKGESASYSGRTAAYQKGSGSSAAKPFGMICSLWWPPYSILCYCLLRHSQLCSLKEAMPSIKPCHSIFKTPPHL